MRPELEAMQNMLQELNSALRNKYEDIFTMEEEAFREKLKSIGSLTQLDPMSEAELADQVDSILGVDGSTNRMGGNYPHYVDLFQGLAKSTSGEEVYIQKIYTPLLDAHSREDLSRKNKYLAQVELEAAIEAVEKHPPSLVMMDGGLIRYIIECEDKWDQLRQVCETEDVLLVGVIKDVKTSMIGEALGYGTNFYDREFLAGKLNYGELFMISDPANSKKSQELSSGFYRSTRYIDVSGIDILESQADKLDQVVRIILSLTPKNGRGVPFWIDQVDREVKITQAYMEGLVQENLDRDLIEQFFVSERDRRN